MTFRSHRRRVAAANAATTGVRRGELCAIRHSSVDLTEGRETIWLRRATQGEPGAGWVEGDLKTHQQCRIALDSETVTVLREHLEYRKSSRGIAHRVTEGCVVRAGSVDSQGI